MLENIYSKLGVSKEVLSFCTEKEAMLEERFKKIDAVAEINQLKVLNAMQINKLSDIHFAYGTGYGYNDLGREAIEKIYATLFNTEMAIVRPSILCGTHAITVALFGNLRPNDELLSPVGKPYDTLDNVIGLNGTSGSLKEYNISYKQVELLDNSEFDYEGIKNSINERTKLVTIQRSKGYSFRKTFSVEKIGELISFIKGIKQDVICMVDNCYGEFVETIEPSDVGADLVVGSLIKNPGGGLAPIGGYIVGKESYIKASADRLSCPGLGLEIGASLGVNRSFIQGLFMAPTVTAAALKGAILAANIFENLGFSVLPNSKENRYDIIQSVEFGDRNILQSFCEGIQAAAPVDSFVTPTPWEMPGYSDEVIMAAGTFIQGASIELSADAPMRPPYIAYFQGGLTYPHAKFGIILSLQKMYEKGLVKIK